MSKVRAMLPLADMWRPVLAAVVLLALLISLFVFRLGSLTSGFSEPEILMRDASRSARLILENPLNLHQKASIYLLHKTDTAYTSAIRLPSALVAVSVVISMYYLLKVWFTWRIAVLGSLLVASSSWLLHTARLATGDSSYLLPFIFAIGGIWLIKKRATPRTAFFLTLLTLILLYVPGLIWFLVVSIIWQRNAIKSLIRHLSFQWRIVLGILFILGLIPLMWAIIQDSKVLISWLGFPSEWPSFEQYARNVLSVPIRLLVKGDGNPLYGLGHLPLLDAFTSAMLLLGLFASCFRFRLDRTKLVLGTIILSSLLVGLNGPVSIAFLLPPVYLLVATGVALLLQQWLTVFPRNPFARWLGILLVTSAVLISSFYHLSRYFVAWPKTPETKAVFQHD